MGAPDFTVKIVSDNPDAEVSVVGNQVIEATPADVGKVVTVAADGSLVLAEGGGGGVTDHGALTGLADDDHSAYSLTSHAHSGTYVPLSLVDAAGDLLQGSADNTLERVAKGTAGQVWRMKADASKGEFGPPIRFKRAVRDGLGNVTTTSTSRTPIDATNLPYQVLPGCVVGDVLEMTLALVSYSSGATYVCFDFEVDQPSSANVYVGSANDRGVLSLFGTAGPYPHLIHATFVVTEAGDHGVRPVWFVTASTGNIYNAASGDGDNLVAFTVKNLGAPA